MMFSVDDMTSFLSTDLAPAPPLDLPHGSLGRAIDAVQAARDALRSARHVEWVSVAADAYQDRLTELDARLMVLEDNVYDARRHCWAAQAAADGGLQ